MKKQRGLELAVTTLVVKHNTDYPTLLLYPNTTWESTTHQVTGPSYFSVEEWQFPDNRY